MDGEVGGTRRPERGVVKGRGTTTRDAKIASLPSLNFSLESNLALHFGRGTHELSSLQAGLSLASALQECLPSPPCVPVPSHILDSPLGHRWEQRDCVTHGTIEPGLGFPFSRGAYGAALRME